MDEDTRWRDVAMHPPQVMDRVTFRRSDDTLSTGYVAAVERNGASGDWIIWVEPEHDFSDGFTAITRHELVDSDNDGARRRTLADEALWLHLARCDFTRESGRKNAGRYAGGQNAEKGKRTPGPDGPLTGKGDPLP